MAAYESLHGAVRFAVPPPDQETALTEKLAVTLSTEVQMRFGTDAPVGEWTNHAACRGADPDLFSLDGDAAAWRVAKALAHCRACPVIEACRARRYEIGAYGIWGGVHYREAQKGVRQCATPGCSEPVINAKNGYCGWQHEHDAKVGTRRGYDLHIRRKEKACPACREAATVERRRTRKTAAAGEARVIHGQAVGKAGRQGVNAGIAALGSGRSRHAA